MASTSQRYILFKHNDDMGNVWAPATTRQAVNGDCLMRKLWRAELSAWMIGMSFDGPPTMFVRVPFEHAALAHKLLAEQSLPYFAAADLEMDVGPRNEEKFGRLTDTAGSFIGYVLYDEERFHYYVRERREDEQLGYDIVAEAFDVPLEALECFADGALSEVTYDIDA